MAERNWDDTDIQDGDQIPTDEWVAHINDQKGHSARHEAGGSDETPVENLGTSGAVDTVPVSQGDGSLAMEPAQQYWTEDSNSPFTASQTSSITATLADRYDEWRITIKVDNADSDGNQSGSLIFNDGNSAAYQYYQADGSVNDSNNSIPIQFSVDNGGEGLVTSFVIAGRWASSGFATVNFALSSVAALSQIPVTIAHAEESPPLDSLTYTTVGPVDFTIRAFGRDV